MANYSYFCIKYETLTRHRMRQLLIILFSLFCLVLEAQTLHFHQLTVKDGLPSNSVIALCQDTKGMLWVATTNGLCRYNGERLEPLTIDGLPDKRIDRMNCAADGTIWLQCYERHNLVSLCDLRGSNTQRLTAQPSRKTPEPHLWRPALITRLACRETHAVADRLVITGSRLCL